MDRQYYTLMEAYYKVYDEVEQLDEVSAQTAMKASKAADDKANGMSHNGDHNGASKKRKQAVNLYQKALARAKNKTQANESVDNYDLIMSYLLDEGFADTEADAEVIMANMSEDWLDSILDEGLTGWRKDYAIKRAEELRDRSRVAGDIAKRGRGGKHGIADKMNKRAASLIRVATKDIGGKWEANPKKRGGSGIKGEPKDMEYGVDKSRSNKNDKQLMKSKLRKRAIKSIREEYDNYDLIMSYLLDEGFADTETDAEVIMANMSEDWLEDILEGFKPTNYNQGPDIFKGRGKKAQQLDRQIAKHKKEGNVVKSMNMDFINRMMDDPESRKESMEKSRRNRMKSDARARRDAQQDVKKYGLS